MKRILILLLCLLFLISGCKEEEKADILLDNSKENKQIIISNEQIVISQETTSSAAYETPEPVSPPPGLSFSEAKEQEGFFIKTEENRFLPLQSEVETHAYGKTYNIFLVSEKYENIPCLTENDHLVLFSNKSPKEKYWFLPVLDEGYTIPFTFYSKWESHDKSSCVIINKDFRDFSNQLVEDYPDWQVQEMLSNWNNGFNEIRLELDTINGMDPFAFMDSETFDSKEYCTEDSPSICNSEIYFKGTSAADTVSIGFYSGTQYFEKTFRADLKYYAIDGCQKKDFRKSFLGIDYFSGIEVEPTLTKEGYAILDADNLESGKYVVASTERRYIFSVK